MIAQQARTRMEDRPRLWRFYRDLGLRRDEVGAAFGRSAEWVRLLCLPFTDPNRRVPSPEDVERFHTWSGGVLGPADWYPPGLSAAEPVTPGAAVAGPP